jgi:hypothetical protein
MHGSALRALLAVLLQLLVQLLVPEKGFMVPRVYRAALQSHRHATAHPLLLLALVGTRCVGVHGCHVTHIALEPIPPAPPVIALAQGVRGQVHRNAVFQVCHKTVI